RTGDVGFSIVCWHNYAGTDLSHVLHSRFAVYFERCVKMGHYFCCHSKASWVVLDQISKLRAMACDCAPFCFQVAGNIKAGAAHLHGRKRGVGWNGPTPDRETEKPCSYIERNLLAYSKSRKVVTMRVMLPCCADRADPAGSRIICNAHAHQVELFASDRCI